MKLVIVVLLVLILAAAIALCVPRSRRGDQSNQNATPLHSPPICSPNSMNLTEAQKKITQKFGLNECAVTCASEKVLYNWTDASRGPSTLRWVPENVKALKDLAFAADVYVACQVNNDSEEEIVRKALAKCGLTPTIPSHKILFYESPISKEAILRQLSPKFHFDGDVEFSAKMQKYITNVVTVESADACGSSSEEACQTVVKLEDYWAEKGGVAAAISTSATAQLGVGASSGLVQRKPGGQQ